MNAFTPDPIPWATLAGPLAAAGDAVARLDERLRVSPIREGWIARTHFAEAAASLWRDGELVFLEDLVLHDAGMDVRAPTEELVRAHAVLRARRRIAGKEVGWALSPAGLDALRGRAASRHGPDGAAGQGLEAAAGGDEDPPDAATLLDTGDEPWAAEFADLDRLVARSGEALERRVAQDHGQDQDHGFAPLVYDRDWDEDARLAEWRAVVDATAQLPPLLAAALAAQAWEDIAPLQHLPWLGRLLTAALLRDRGVTRAHLLCLNTGLRALPRERRPARADSATRLIVWLDALSAAALTGCKEHDRWLNARRQLERRLTGRRSTSNLPALIDLVLATPIASAGMIARRLEITPRAAQNLVAELGLREATGRGRYRAWGIL